MPVYSMYRKKFLNIEVNFLNVRNILKCRKMEIYQLGCYIQCVCVCVCVCVCDILYFRISYFFSFYLFVPDSVLQEVETMNSCRVPVILFTQMRMYAHQISPFFTWKEAKQPHWKLSKSYNSLLSMFCQPYFLMP